MKSEQLTPELKELENLTNNIVNQIDKYEQGLEECITLAGRVLKSQEAFKNAPKDDILGQYDFIENSNYENMTGGYIETRKNKIIENLRRSEYLKNSSSEVIKITSKFVRSIKLSEIVVVELSKKIHVDFDEFGEFDIHQCYFTLKWLNVTQTDGGGVIIPYTKPKDMINVYLQAKEEFKEAFAKLSNLMEEATFHNSKVLNEFRNEISPFELLC